MAACNLKGSVDGGLISTVNVRNTIGRVHRNSSDYFRPIHWGWTTQNIVGHQVRQPSPTLRARLWPGRPGARRIQRDLALLLLSSLLLACGTPRATGAETSISTAPLPSSAESTASDLILSTTPPSSASVPSADPDGVAEYWAEGFVVETPDHGPMITEFLEGPLPGGGEVAVENWSWDDVSGERNANGHIWGGPWHIIGIWDGTQLTVTRIPLSVPEIEFNPPTAATPGCNSDGFTETRSRISELDFRSIGLLSLDRS